MKRIKIIIYGLFEFSWMFIQKKILKKTTFLQLGWNFSSEKRIVEELRDAINNCKPFMYSRIGTVEGEFLYFLDFKKAFHIIIKKWSDRTDSLAAVNAGIVIERSQEERFRELYYEGTINADILERLNWWFGFQNYHYSFNKKKSLLIARPEMLNPYTHLNWLSILKHKRVVVVHPFKQTILHQWSRKNDWGCIFPDLDLRVVKAVNNIGGELDTAIDDWFEGLEKMIAEIFSTDFDVCIIGAGAYGLPLASAVKKKGKVAIHTGGMTQLLFGITGKRWEKETYINENWIRPLSEDYNSGNMKKVENGAYV